MSNNKGTVLPQGYLDLLGGSPEIGITNLGFSEAKYTFTQRFEHEGESTTTQVLTGTGAVQTYENVRYPIRIHNIGDQQILVS